MSPPMAEMSPRLLITMPATILNLVEFGHHMRRTENWLPEQPHHNSMSTFFKVSVVIGEYFQQPIQYVDNLCQSISLLVLQGTLDENHIVDEERNSSSPNKSIARPSCASSSSDDPKKSSRKKHDKGEAGSSHKADDLEDTFGYRKAAERLARQTVGTPKALPNLATKHLQTVVQEVSWRDNSSYGDSPKNRMHQGLDKWARNTYGKQVDHRNFPVLDL
jgi:hypothetical protein